MANRYVLSEAKTVERPAGLRCGSGIDTTRRLTLQTGPRSPEGMVRSSRNA